MDDEASFKIGDKIPHALEDKRQDNLGESAKATPFFIVGASARGRLHYHNDAPRDDAFVARFNGTWLAVSVADGAGSKTLSRHGASFLANRLCSRLLQATSPSKIPGHQTAFKIGNQQTDEAVHSPPSFEGKITVQKLGELVTAYDETGTKEQNHLGSIMLKAFSQARIDLERFAKRNGASLEDLHSTLLGLILNTETMEMGIGQIGDGLILGLDDKEKAITLADPPSSDDPAASYFITQEDWEQYLYTKGMTSKEVNHFSTFYLMTDGVANDCQYGPPANILEIWARDMDREIRLVPSIEATAERLKNYLASYKAKGSFDDRTLVVIYRNREDKTT